MDKRNALVGFVVVNNQLMDPLAVDPLSDCTTQYLNLDIKNDGKKVQNLVSHQKQDQLTDPLAIDPLSECTMQCLNQDIKKEEEEVQNLVSSQKQEEEVMTSFLVKIDSSDVCTEETSSNFQEKDPLSNISEVPLVSRILSLDKNEPLDQDSEEEEKRSTFPIVIVSEALHPEESISPEPQVEDPLADIPCVHRTSKIPATIEENVLKNTNFPDEPIKPTRPVLIQEEESSLQRSENGDPETVFENESGHEVIPVRNEELEPEHGTLNGSFRGQNSNVSEEEINGERRMRKSAVAALASIHRSRVESDENSETDTCSDDDYSIDSESSVSEKEGYSRSVKQKIHTTPVPPTAATTITTIATTASASVLATSSSQIVSILSSLQASPHACSEKCNCSRLEMQYHTADCHLTHSETHHQAASPQVQHFIHVKANSNQQQGHLISAVTSDVPKKRVTLTRTLASSPTTTAAVVTTTTTTTTTSISTAVSTPSQSGSTVSSLLQASCTCSEKRVSSGIEIEYHSLGCPHAHPEAPLQASASQLLQRRVLVQKNSSQQQLGQFHSGLISSDEVAKQKADKSPGQIAKSNLRQNSTSDLHVLYVGKKYVSILKPLSGQTVQNHTADFTKNKIDVYKMPKEINTPKCAKEETLTIASALGNKPKSLLLRSREQSKLANDFIIRNGNKKYKETLLDLKRNCNVQCNDEVKSTGTEENVHTGEIIIHPKSGLLVSKISYDSSNKNDKVQKGFLYECLKCRQIFSSEQYEQTHSAPCDAEEQSFACHKCEQRMTLHLELAEHYHKKHPSRKQCVCPICGSVLSRKKALDYHILYVHSSSRPHVCEICSKAFKNDSGLQSHLIMHDSSNNFKCDKCNLYFKRKGSHRVHMRRHTGMQTVKCHKCDKIIQKDGLRRHLKEVHTAERNFLCKVCHKKFVSQARLTLHVKVVHDKQYGKHVCEVCGKEKKTVGALTDHMNIHSGEKPYTCHVCGKSFFENRKLQNHLILHGEKKFKCDMCGYTCTRMDNLVTHIRSHTGEKPYKCTFCNKAFTRMDNLQTHKRQVHNTLSSKSK